MRRLQSTPLIEPLESRIAPASLILLANTFQSHISNSSTGQVLEFIHASSPGTDPANIAIAKTVGDSADVFFIKVSAGETVKIDVPFIGYENLVNVTQGTVIAFLTDLTGSPSDAVKSTELTGVSLGNNVAVGLGFGVNGVNGHGGYIVTNYNDKTGELGGSTTDKGSTEAPGVATMLLPNVVDSLAVAGPVTGDFIAGAAVFQFEATGAVGKILTGTAANAVTYSFTSVANTTGNTTLAVGAPALGVAGPSIANVIVDSVGLIHLGAGGPRAAGGSLTNMTLLDDTTGFTVIAGAGGTGGIGRAYGGTGGNVTNVVVNGPPAGSPDLTPNSAMFIEAGAGGRGTGPYRGGAGGGVQNVFVDYSSLNINSANNTYMADNVTVEGGAGGGGGTGGAGGTLTDINIITATPHDTTPGAIEFQVLGGAGGSSTVGGRGGGAGGAVTDSLVENMALPVTPPFGLPNDLALNSPTNTHAIIQAGPGGNSAVRGPGGAGGYVADLTLKGYNFAVVSGAGGNGVGTGGAGGGIGYVNVLGSSGNLPGDNYHLESLVITAGAGGNGSAGVGGAGGSINAVTATAVDFSTPGLNVTAGAGGSARKGSGGAGGAVTNMSLTGVDFLTDSHPLGTIGALSITGGAGGASPVYGGHGGAGGVVDNVSFVGTRLNSSSITGGAGGAGGASGITGRGGPGGTVTGVSLRDTEDLLPSNTTATAGLLMDTTADFFSAGIVVGDTVLNLDTGATTSVTAAPTAASPDTLQLGSDIFAQGDPYEVENPSTKTAIVTGAADATQLTIVDISTNFLLDGVKDGDIVQNLSDAVYNLTLPLAGQITTTTATVLSVAPHTLTVSADISRVGDEYTIASLVPGLGAVTLTGGAGGAGGRYGAGGAGGGVVTSSAVLPGTISLTGGAGGKGGAIGTSGVGGSVNNDGAISSFGSSVMTAGNAGALGAKAGAGGSVTGANIQALLDVTLIAGNGFAGGAGGNVSTSGFTGAPSDSSGLNLNPPTGNITIKAGAGGASATGIGGAGGSVLTLTGFISSGNGLTPVTTQFDAGAGGKGVTKGGAGGSVSGVRFFGGGGADVTFFINAGDAGNSPAGRIGATGGSVTNIGGGAFGSGSGDPNFSVSPLTDFHNISAGDGGNAAKTGGLGGSVADVFVNAAIGVPTGVKFGFNLGGAGGISVGAGGLGATRGMAGNVTDIAADSIASIVAGHITSGQALEQANLANKVQGITLNGNSAPSLVYQFNLSFDGETTVSLPTNASPLEVAAALNSLTTIQTAGGVSVTDGANGYAISFNRIGKGAGTNATNTITGKEPGVFSDGITVEVVKGADIAATATTPAVMTQEVQDVPAVLSPFTLSFMGENTTLLGRNATPIEVADALNALPAIKTATTVINPFTLLPVVEGVTVVAGTGSSNNSYVITFGSDGAQPLITSSYSPFARQVVQGSAVTDTSEVQNLQVLPADAFTLSFGGYSSGALPAGATPAQVQIALNKMPSINTADGGVGNVTVTSGPSLAGFTNPSYTITFQDTAGAQPLIVPNFIMGRTTSGNTATFDVQTVTFANQTELDPVQMAGANFVGSIVTPFRPDSTVFHYTALVAGPKFEFGDAPIDGLIAASNLTAVKNFVPEAFVSSIGGSAVLIDNLNS